MKLSCVCKYRLVHESRRDAKNTVRKVARRNLPKAARFACEGGTQFIASVVLGWLSTGEAYLLRPLFPRVRSQ